MKVLRGVLVQPLDKQADERPLDPKRVAYHPDEVYPATICFDNKRLIGTARVWGQNGAIMTEVKIGGDGLAMLQQYGPPFKAAISVIERDAGYKAVEVAVVHDHADANQPDAEILEK